MSTPSRPRSALQDKSLLRDRDALLDSAEGPIAAEHDREEEFAAHVVSAQDRVFRFILTLVPNSNDAEDLLQETLATVWKIQERFDSGRDFVRWACGIAHNHVRNYLRSRRKGTVSLSLELLDQLAQARLEAEGVFEARQRALAGCLAKLPRHDCTLIERCYARGATINEVAERAGKSPNILYKALRQIRARLYDCITRTLREEAT
jgi:RNA polymerase sigma-70 factor (ECF subfamily)